MKTTLFLILFSSLSMNAQKKDFTEKQLLTNKRVIELASNEKTESKNVVAFLKCLKTESKLKTFKELPFFTNSYPLIVDKRIKEHNEELWEGIILECKQNNIFLIKN